MTNSVPIARFEEKYLITCDGRVQSLQDYKYLKLSKNPNGYYKISLSLNGNKDQVLIHRLVALHFIPNPYGYEQVNHKDGDKANNNVSNLEWCSREQNIQHSLEAGLRKGFMSAVDKENYLHRVLKGEQVKDIAATIGRRAETLHKMLRETALRMNLETEWKNKMKENRINAAIRNLKKINT